MNSTRVSEGEGTEDTSSRHRAVEHVNEQIRAVESASQAVAGSIGPTSAPRARNADFAELRFAVGEYLERVIS